MSDGVPEFAATGPALSSVLATFGERAQIVENGVASSFAAIADGSARIARGLLAAGVAKGTRVGLLLPNGADYVEVLFGLLRMGGHAVLISTLAKPRELAFMIRNADIDTLVTAKSYLGHDYVAALEEALPSLAAASAGRPLQLCEAPYLRSIWMLDVLPPSWSRGNREALEMLGHKETSAELLTAVEAEIVPADPAVMIFTSGSTADPKAIVHSHGALVRQARQMSRYMTFEPGDRLLTTMPFFWVGGLITALLAANLRGAALVCPSRRSAEGIFTSLENDHVTHVSLWADQLGALFSASSVVDMRSRLKPTSAQQLGIFGLATPERTPNSLGMTETLGPHSMEFFGAPLPVDRAGSFGRAVGEVERKIVDPVTGVTLSAGEVGELCLRGGTMMLGFHRHERAAVFDADGFYRTGDLAALSPDGHLFFTARRGDMVKTGGANVAPREVEMVLAAQHDIAEAVVIGLPDPAFGEMLVAAVVLHEGAEPDEAGLHARLHRLLSSYKVPRRLIFLASDDMPYTASGKIRKPILRDILRARLGR